MKVRQFQHCLYSPASKVGILLLLCCHISDSMTIRENHIDEALLDDVLTALERTVGFFAEDYVSVNLDGLFGIRISQGSVAGSVKDCSGSEMRCPVEVIKRLERIEAKLGQTADRAMPYVQGQDPIYFSEFLPTIDAPYVMQFADERLGDAPADPAIDSSYNEDRGDECFSKVFGTFTENNRLTPKCTVSDDCWEYMTRPNTALYATTHQLLYFVFGEKTGCSQEFQKHSGDDNSTTVENVKQRLCRMIYSEAKEEVESGTVSVLKQDIFLEQSALCGLVGFQDFASPKWIRMVLGWQTARGCFTMPHSLISIESELNKVQESQRQLLDLLNEEAIQIDENYPVWKGRQLLREKIMDGDCLAHKTGLGVGVLGVYTRQLVRQLYKS